MSTSPARRRATRRCRIAHSLTSVAVLTCLVATSPTQGRPPQPRQALQGLHLVENQGQWGETAAYCAPFGAAATVWFAHDGFTFDLRAGAPESTAPEHGAVVRSTFAGALPSARIEASRRQRRYYNFFVGNDPERWRGEVPAFGQLRYRSLYEGIDLVVRPGRGLFAYDLHLAPGADPSVLQMQFTGVDAISITPEGDLLLSTPHGELRQSAPVAWQGRSPDRSPVECRFVLHAADRVGFAVSGRDPLQPLVIDPDVTWSTYFGGTLQDPLLAMTRGPTTGPTAQVTTVGRSSSLDYPTTTGAYQTSLSGGFDNVITRFDPAQTGTAQVVWSTYLGGSTVNAGTLRDEAPFVVHIDVLGNVVVAGSTKCTDFPVTTGALQTTFGGGEADGFVSKLDGKGAALLYSTFFGGNSNDWICDLELSSVFIASVVGFTSSTNLPTVNPAQATIGGQQDLFAARIDPTRAGSAQLIYSTYLGGSLDEGLSYTSGRTWENRRNLAMDLDSTGRILLASSTTSANYPVVNPFLSTIPSASFCGVVSILDPGRVGAAQLVYSTYLGGLAIDHGRCAAFAGSGRVAVAGITQSSGFPTTTGAFDTSINGTAHNTFVTWLDPAKAGTAQLAYSTFLGGAARPNRVFHMVLDDCGVANLNGICGDGFPTTPGAFDRTHNTIDDGWFARLAPDGNGTADLVYSTLLGGGPSANNTHTFVTGSVLDGEGGVFLCGRTRTPQFPTTAGAYKTALTGNNDGFVTHLWGLNHGVEGIGAATPAACAGGLLMGAQGAPTKGNNRFRLTAWGAQANAQGFLGVGLPPRLAAPVCAATLHVNPVLVVPVGADAKGEVLIPAPIAATTPTGTSVVAQFVFGNTGCCLTMTNALQVTVRR